MPIFNNVLGGAAGSGGAAADLYEIQRSLRFDKDDSPSLSKSFGSSGNRKKWTFSCWFKLGLFSQPGRFFSAGSSASERTNIYYHSSNSSSGIAFYSNVGGSVVGQCNTLVKLRDPSAWYHLVFVFDCANSTNDDKIKIYINGVRHTVSYQVHPSNIDHYIGGNVAHYIGRGADGYSFDGHLAECHYVNGQALAPTDFGEFNNDTGVWNPIDCKDNLTYGTNGFYLNFSDNTSNDTLGTDSSGGNNTFNVSSLNATTSGGLAGSASLNDGASPAENTAYANIWNGSVSSYPGDFLTAANGHEIILQWSPSLTNVTRLEYYTYNGYDRHKLNNGSWSGQTSTSGGWVDAYNNSSSPISVSKLQLQKYDQASYVKIGGIRVNGVHAVTLTDADIDSFVDSPTNYDADSGNNGGNYATLNPLQNAGLTLTGGNLDVSKSSSGWRSATGTIGMSSGKFYWEYRATSANDYHIVGVCDTKPNLNTYAGEFTPGWIYQSNGNKQHNDNWNSGHATASSGGDIIQVAVDMDAGKIWFGVNNSWIGSGNPSNGTNAAYDNLSDYAPVLPVVSQIHTTNGSINFGQRPFTHTPPTGFKSLCTQNLEDTAYASIPNGESHFAVPTWIVPPNNGDTTISGLKFAPDIVWTKNRSNNYEGFAYDRARGDDKYFKLFSSNNGGAVAEGTDATRMTLQPNGFELDADNDNANYSAGSNSVAFAWNAGSQTSDTTKSVGSLNNYLSGAVYSNDLSSNDSGGVSNASQAFDGNLSTRANNATSADTYRTLVWAPATAITFSEKFEIYCDQGTSTPIATWNNNTVQPGGGQWVTVYTGSGTINSTYPLTINTVSAAQWATLKAVRLDGQILVDSNITPPSVPTIATQYRANPEAGISICKYVGNGSSSGATIAHGLNAVPEMIIVKNRDEAYEWGVYHKEIGTGVAQVLSAGNNNSVSNSWWNNTAPTSEVFNIGWYQAVNNNTKNYVAYVFAPVTGFSAFGKYTGNTGVGPFIYTGFRPSWILIKRTDSSGGWVLWDTARNPLNVATEELYPDDSSGDYTGGGIDILSNGFKMRNTSAHENTNNATYIWAAFAENPFKISRAR